MPSVVKDLQHTHWDVRRTAAELIGSLAQASPELAADAMPHLELALRDRDIDVRRATAKVNTSLD